MISIIIPIFNVEPFIGQCINSIITQDYVDLEVLLIDDKGSDNSLHVAQQIINEYTGPIVFKVFAHDKNRGLSAARNTGINHAQGEWLFFLDSDDWIEPDCFGKLIKLADKYPGVEIIQSCTRIVGEGYKWMDFSEKALPEYCDDAQWIRSTLLQRHTLTMTATNKLIRRDFLDYNKINFVEGLIHEDEVFNLDLALALNTIAICKDYTYNYVIRNNSITTSIVDQKIKLERHRKLWQVELARVSHPVPDDIMKMIWRHFHETFYNFPSTDLKDSIYLFSSYASKKVQGRMRLYALLFPFRGVRRLCKHLI